MGDRSFKIRITQQLIDTAEQCDSVQCMIAIALRDQHDAWSIRIDDRLIRFNTGKKGTLEARRHFAETPAWVAVELRKWEEDRQSIKPFSFTLDKNLINSDNVAQRGKAVRPYKPRDPEWYQKMRAKPKRVKRRYAGRQGIHLAEERTT